MKKLSRNDARQKKHKRIRKKLSGTAESPRMCIFRSHQHTYAQIIDDDKGVTLVAASTLEEGLKELQSKTDINAAKSVGVRIAEKAKAKGVKTVVFDRNGYKYHGCVAAFADAARENGLDF